MVVDGWIDMNCVDAKSLEREIKACRICVEEPIGKALPHKPNPVLVLSQSAKIAICGQAPGNKVNISGKPFTDPSGDRLRSWLGVSNEVFYDPDKFAIIPMGFCFPGNDEKGGDLPPRKECKAKWHDLVFSTMPQIELLLLVGGYAQKHHLGKQMQKTLTQTVFQWRDYFEDGALKKMVLPHPSWRNTGWIKKNPWFETDLLPVLKEEVGARI